MAPANRSANPWFRMNAMNRAIGVVLNLVGFVWFFQGIGVAQGSEMSGNLWWAALGAAFVVAGFIVLYRANLAAKKVIAEEQAAESGGGATTSGDADQRDDRDERPDPVQEDK